METNALLGRLCAIEKAAQVAPLPYGTPDQASKGTHRTWASGLPEMPKKYDPGSDYYYKKDKNYQNTKLKPGDLYRDRSINKAAYLHSQWKSTNADLVKKGLPPLPLDTSQYFTPLPRRDPATKAFYTQWNTDRNPADVMKQAMKTMRKSGLGPYWSVNDPAGKPYQSKELAEEGYKRAVTLQNLRRKQQQAAAREMFPNIWSQDRGWRY
jgi:hypothetical protein